MNYGIAEQEISDRINTQFIELGLADKFFAAPMPETDTEAAVFEKQITKARCAVEYIDSSYEANSTMGAVRQVEKAKFRLTFESKKMRGDGGLYTMIERIKEFLIGYRLTNAEPLVVTSYGRLQFEPGVWMPFLEMECATLNNQAFEYEDGTVLLKEAKYIDQPKMFTTEFNNDFQ